MVRTEAGHEPVRTAFGALLSAGRPLWTTSFVLVETMALLQHRIGIAAARDFDDDVRPVLRTCWVDEELYRRGTDRLRQADRRHISLVDHVSFEFMIRQGITTALAIDQHFADAGFDVVPSGGA